MRVLIDLDAKTLDKIQKLAHKNNRSRKNMMETIIENEVKGGD